jgi:hypothetical protein
MLANHEPKVLGATISDIKDLFVVVGEPELAISSAVEWDDTSVFREQNNTRNAEDDKDKMDEYMKRWKKRIR